MKAIFEDLLAAIDGKLNTGPEETLMSKKTGFVAAAALLSGMGILSASVITTFHSPKVAALASATGQAGADRSAMSQEMNCLVEDIAMNSIAISKNYKRQTAADKKTAILLSQDGRLTPEQESTFKAAHQSYDRGEAKAEASLSRARAERRKLYPTLDCRKYDLS